MKLYISNRNLLIKTSMSKVNSQMSNVHRGFTLIEILSVLAILAIISTFSYLAFVNLNKSQVLERNASTVVSILEEARSLSVSGKGEGGASRYGVHFEPAGNEVVLFTGDSFDPANPNNKETTLNSAVVISVNLESEREEIVFGRLRGETDDYGSITLSLVNDAEMIKIIAVYPTGVVQKIN